MAGNVQKQPEKISADCPHCGFSQLESAFAKTTFCRKCGQHYSIEKLLAKEAASLKGPSFFERLTKAVSGEKERTVVCHSCAHTHIVISSAQSSLCPACGSYIDLRDFKIDGPFGRSIQTQGEVKITSKGDLANGRIGCGSARIEGKVRGQMICTGEIVVRLVGKVLGAITTAKLTVEKKSDVSFARTVEAGSVSIAGKASAVLHCDGCVTIEKGGVFEGTIVAKSVNFEHGGVFAGELHIGEGLCEQPAAPAVEPPVLVAGDMDEVPPPVPPPAAVRPMRPRRRAAGK